MKEIRKNVFLSKKDCYINLMKELESLIAEDDDIISVLSNCSSIIFHSLDDLNWAGFYLLKNGILVLGPFQGKPACNRITLDKGVCGKAAREQKIVLVPDVHKFEGHIACDSASNSEIVLPIIIKNNLFGVLDIDSPEFNRFDNKDEEGLKGVVEIISKYLDKLIV